MAWTRAQPLVFPEDSESPQTKEHSSCEGQSQALDFGSEPGDESPRAEDSAEPAAARLVPRVGLSLTLR